MFDEYVLQAFLANQGKLFTQHVAQTKEEARDFLEDVCAVVCENADEALAYLEEEMDVTGIQVEAIADIEEVFSVGDGRILVVL